MLGLLDELGSLGDDDAHGRAPLVSQRERCRGVRSRPARSWARAGRSAGRSPCAARRTPGRWPGSAGGGCDRDGPIRPGDPRWTAAPPGGGGRLATRSPGRSVSTSVVLASRRRVHSARSVAKIAVAIPAVPRDRVRVPGPELGIGLGQEGPDASPEAALLRLDQMTEDARGRTILPERDASAARPGQPGALHAHGEERGPEGVGDLARREWRGELGSVIGSAPWGRLPFWRQFRRGPPNCPEGNRRPRHRSKLPSTAQQRSQELHGAPLRPRARAPGPSALEEPGVSAAGRELGANVRREIAGSGAGCGRARWGRRGRSRRRVGRRTRAR